MAVFRKLLSGAKSKIKTPNIRISSEKDGGPSTSAQTQMEVNDELEKRRQDWQEELEEVSEFLVMKSTTEQMEEGAEQIVDTAVVIEKDGKPFLKAVFDVHHFKENEIVVMVEDDQLVLTAQGVDDREDRVYRKTMIRKVDLPKCVDVSLMSRTVENGILSVELPFILPEKQPPDGANVVPIINDDDGKKKIRLIIQLGKEFTDDEVKVRIADGRTLTIEAAYNAEVGKYGKMVNAREFKRQYKLPSHLEAEGVRSMLTEDGRLFIEIALKDEGSYKVLVENEEIDSESDDVSMQSSEKSV